MKTNHALRIVATSARLLTGVLVAVGCVIGIVIGVAAPWPTVEHAPAEARVVPVPGDSVLICNGSFRALGRDTTQAELMVSAGTPRVVSGGSNGDPAPAALEMPDVAGGNGALSFTGAVEDRAVPLIAASESLSLSSEDLDGLSASACRAPQMQTWLVGGDASTGASDVIVLSNASDVPSTVTLTVFGATPGSSTSVVPAMTQIAVSLASLAPDDAGPVVRVTADGAPVRASLQSSFTRVLQAVGVDLQDGSAEAQRAMVFTGVQVTDSATDGEAGTVVRIMAPSADGDAVVQVQRAGTDQVDEYPVALARGMPSEIALNDLEDGSYDVRVSADQPVVAAVRQARTVGRATDFAWMTPAPEISSDLMFAVPTGPDPRLHLSNTGDEPVEVIVTDRDDERRIQVPAGESVWAGVRRGSTPVLSPSAPIHAAVTLTGGEGSADVAGWPLWPDAQAQPAITVYP